MCVVLQEVGFVTISTILITVMRCVMTWCIIFCINTLNENIFCKNHYAVCLFYFRGCWTYLFTWQQWIKTTITDPGTWVTDLSTPEKLFSYYLISLLLVHYNVRISLFWFCSFFCCELFSFWLFNIHVLYISGIVLNFVDSTSSNLTIDGCVNGWSFWNPCHIYCPFFIVNLFYFLTS